MRKNNRRGTRPPREIGMVPVAPYLAASVMPERERFSKILFVKGSAMFPDPQLYIKKLYYQ